MFGSGAEQSGVEWRIVYQCGVKCLEAELRAAEHSETERSGVFGSREEQNKR